MAEVEFEENCAEIKEYLRTVRECKQCITQVPAVLKKLLDLLNTSTALLGDLCSFDTAPPGLQQQCIQSRQQMMHFYEGSALRTLTDSIQGVVHQRLMRMEQISQQSYNACKRRREARAKYLSDTNSKRPFNIAAPSAEKVQRHKEEYTESDEVYRRACGEFSQYRFREMATVQRDFFGGYSGVFALLTNALNLPERADDDDNEKNATAGGTGEAGSVNTRRRLRDRQSTEHSRSADPHSPSPGSSTLNDASSSSPSSSPSKGRIDNETNTPAAPPLAAEEAVHYQRRLSASTSLHKPVAVAPANNGDGGPWRRTASMQSGEVVNGIPVAAGERLYGSAAHLYTTAPSSEPPATPAAAARADEVPQGAEGEGCTRRSSSDTLNNFDSITSNASSLRHQYSFLDGFDDS